METIIIDEKEYYEADEVQKISPIYFKGCRNAREVIKKKEIDDENYAFGICKDNKWEITDGLSKKLDKSYLDQYIKYLNENMDDVGEIDEIDETDNTINVEENQDQRERINKIIHDYEYLSSYDDLRICETSKHVDKLTLMVKEMYINLQFIKSSDGIYVNACDFRDEFMIDVNKLSDFDHREYAYVKHKVFTSTELYLTDREMIRLLFMIKNEKTKQFVEWATDILFSIQMGTEDQKNEVVSKTLNVEKESVREIFDKTSFTMPCIYLYKLGSAKDLREIMNIDEIYADYMYVYKWGMTNNFPKTHDECVDIFAKLGIEIKLIRCNYVDLQYATVAKTDLKNMMRMYRFDCVLDVSDECAILDDERFQMLGEQYDCISRNYNGHIHELIRKFKDYEHMMKQKESEYTIKHNNLEHMMKMKEIEYEHIVKMKENEYEHMVKMKENEYEHMVKMKENAMKYNNLEHVAKLKKIEYEHAMKLKKIEFEHAMELKEIEFEHMEYVIQSKNENDDQ
jgi:hypothetical protein